MEEQYRSWIKGCAVGCGALVVLGVLAVSGGVWSIMAPLNRAVEARSELDEAYGDQCSYAPNPDGAVGADRVEAFLEVRQSLTSACATVDGRSEAMRRLEELDDEAEVSRSEVLELAGRATLGAFGLGPALSHLYETRNSALVEAEMGLGEYTYIYVMAYHDRLLDRGPRTGILDGSPVNRRIRGCLAEMLRAQSEAVRQSGSDPEWIARLLLEADTVESDPDRLPWNHGLPETVATSFAPFRDRLDDLFCDGASELELLRNRRRALAIESE